MRLWVLQRLLAVMIASFAIATMVVAPATAQTAPSQTVAQLLQQNPNGGQQLIAAIRDLAVSDHSALDAIINALATANSDQQTAIGTGLAQAANATVGTDPAYANTIAQRVTQSGSQFASNAYAGASQVAIGATGGGGGAAGGGGGGGGIGGQTGNSGVAFGGINSGTAQTFGSSTHANQPTNFFSGGGSSSIGSTGTTTTTASVSPRR